MGLRFHNHYQRMQRYGCAAPMVKKIVVHDDGSVETIYRKSNDALPDASLFDLEANLKAKVNLDEVPTKIVDTGLMSSEFIDKLNSMGEDEIQPQDDSKSNPVNTDDNSNTQTN